MFDMSNESWRLFLSIFNHFDLQQNFFQQQAKPLEPKRRFTNLIITVISDQCLICQMKAGVSVNKCLFIFIYNKTFFQQQTKTLEPKTQKSCLFVYQFDGLLKSPVIRYQCLICQMLI